MQIHNVIYMQRLIFSGDHKEFLISFWTLNWGWGGSNNQQTQLRAQILGSQANLVVHRGVPHNSTPSDLTFSNLKLRLDQSNHN